MPDHALAPYPAGTSPYASATGRTDEGPGQALISGALVATVFIAGVGLAIVGRHLPGLDSRVLSQVLYALPGLLLAGAVAARGRTIARRLCGGGLVLAALAVETGYSVIVLPRLFRLLVDDPGSPVLLLRVAQTVESGLVVALLVAAWGIVRRHHPAWLMGLIVAIAMAGAVSWFQLYRFLPGGGQSEAGIALSVAMATTLFQAIPVAGGLLGWLTDRALAPRV